MLPESRFDFLNTRLEQFKLHEQERQDQLQNLLTEYTELLESYRILRKAHDQTSQRILPARAARANGNASHGSYVLVLIDGNEYIFNDELIQEKVEGGMRAARLLNDAIERHIRQAIPNGSDARIIVRIYANFATLSKQLAQSKLVGFDKRSIAPFVAGFNRAFSFIDLVDTLDEEGTKFKIREQFRAAVDDDKCEHILFAACHDLAYRSSLMPYKGMLQKITLVQGAGWKPEFHNFDLNVTQFPTVFRWSELPPLTPGVKATTPIITVPKAVTERPTVKQMLQRPIASNDPRLIDDWRKGSIGTLIEVDNMSSKAPSTVGQPQSTVELQGMRSSKYSVPDIQSQEEVDQEVSQEASREVCRFFKKGVCRFGDECKMQHAARDSDSLSRTSDPPSTPRSDRFAVSRLLPTSAIPGYILVNAYDQRLDAYIRPPTREEWNIYNARFSKNKPCNDFHLRHACDMADCIYDHSELEPEALHTLEYVVKCQPCPRRSRCREASCYLGHICQKDGCRGHMKGCKMKKDLHDVDPNMEGTVPAEDELVLGIGTEEPRAGSAGTPFEMPMEENFLW
ncbi:hypothetical protein ACN47E_000812 [Coniothyrium glycines]